MIYLNISKMGKFLNLTKLLLILKLILTFMQEDIIMLKTLKKSNFTRGKP